MSNIKNARSKYDRKTQGKGGYWMSRTTAAEGKQCAKLAEFLEMSPAQVCSSAPAANYRAGVQAAGAESYNRGVAGKGAAWEQGLVAAYSSK